MDLICDRHPGVVVKWFDAGGLSSDDTNFVTCRFNDLQAYQYIWEGLRSMELFSRPYLRIVDVIVGRSQGDRAHTQANGRDVLRRSRQLFVVTKGELQTV